MTSYSHAPNNHLSRRASITATAPYTIPSKSHSSSLSSSTPFSPPNSNVHVPQHQQSHSPHPNHSHTTSQQQQQQQQLSSSVPLLSREFVVRRISEGESGRLKEELKCEACGKGYKHISSLAKHLWEHTPEWNVTKKLLISKHQQVQLLEAASILISMNEVPSSPKSGQPSVPTIDEESGIKFNPKYRDTSPNPISEQPEDEAEDQLDIKLRAGSISQYPPSTDFNSSSPAKIFRQSLNNGGFLDTPSRLNRTINSSGDNSDVNTPISNGEHAIIDDEDEEEHGDSNANDDDEGVFGKMD